MIGQTLAEMLQERDERIDALEADAEEMREQIEELQASLHAPAEREFHEDLLGLDEIEDLAR